MKMKHSRYYPIDFHIHTALSSCADNEMSPKNIVNCALELGLKAIAITDHNSCLNVRSVINEAKKKDLIVIPGMEIESKEGVHILTFFDNVNSCEKMQQYIHSKMPKVKNNIDYFGNQLVFHSEGVKEFPNLLTQSTEISLFDICEKVNDLDGVYIPAHIQRRHNGLVSVLGFLPENIEFITLEIAKRNYEEYKNEYNNYNIIINSDAHRLTDLYQRPTAAFEIKEDFSIEVVFNILSNFNSDRIKSF